MNTTATVHLPGTTAGTSAGTIAGALAGANENNSASTLAAKIDIEQVIQRNDTWRGRSGRDSEITVTKIKAIANSTQ